MRRGSLYSLYIPASEVALGQVTFKLELVVALGTALAILVGVGVLSYRRMLREDEDQRWVAHTHLVLEKLDAILTDLVDE
jgi:hypothetical protein